MTSNNHANRRLLGFGLMILSALLLIGVLAWRLLGFGNPAPTDSVTARFTSTPGGAPVETAAPLRVDVNVDLQEPAGAGPRFSPSVDLQLRDAANRPAPFGDTPGAPVVMHVGGTLTSWTSDLSAPTQPGRYHAHLFIRNAGRPDFEVDLAQPVLDVVPATAYAGGLVYSRSGNLWRTDATGGHTHRLTFYSGDGRAQDPAWAPDGTRIVFARALPASASQVPNTEIWTMPIAGGAATQLVPRRPSEDLVAPAFAAGGALYFASDQVLMPKTGATPTIDQLTNAVESWTIDKLDPAGAGGARGLVLDAARSPDVSRDGRQMVYLHAPATGAESEQPVTHTLMLAQGDGQNPRVLVADGRFQDIYAPRISPDGTQVAFAGVNPFDVPGGGLHLIQVLGLAPLPALANGVPWDIYLVSTAGGLPMRLTHLNADLPFPAWSHDGRRLAILTERALYILDLAHPANPPAQIGPGSSHGQLAWYGP